MLSIKFDKQAFLEYLDNMFGTENGIIEIQGFDTLYPIYVFFYEHMPEENMLTAITYGFDNNYNTQTEFIVTLESLEYKYVISMIHLMMYYSMRGTDHTYGCVLRGADPFLSDSDMNSLFIAVPSFMDMSESKIELANKMIYLKGLYSIYPEEVDMIREIGLEAFWHHDWFDMYDIHRLNIGKKLN